MTCSPDNSVRQIIDMICGHNVHRVYVVDGQQRPTAVVTLTDVLKALVAFCDDLSPEAEAMYTV